MITFKQLASSTTKYASTHFLELIKEHNMQYETSYFIFNNKNNEENFFQTLDFLADEPIWTKEELTNYTFIAQTIDNDYILATETQTLIIPYSCYKTDSECFNTNVFDFFSSYEQDLLHSTILSK